MIDFHSHILPGIDDGSKNTEESIALLRLLKEQGIDTVVATPHFYADEQSVDRFLAKREQALCALRAELPEGLPQIVLGTEVLYYPGISKMAGLERLCIEGTKLLLLEMPMSKWTEYTVKELFDLSRRNRFKLVIAHLDRYMHYQSKSLLAELYECGILVQMNASFFLQFSTKRKALQMLDDREIHMLGSDCHNVTSRAPRIGEAYTVIRKKIGDDFLHEFDRYGRYLLKKV